jgi:hypothetical protein
MGVTEYTELNDDFTDIDYADGVLNGRIFPRT